MHPYPLLFEPLLKPRVWGGHSLQWLGKSVAGGERIGESWEVADLPPPIEGGRSVITNGELAGTTLHQAIERHRQPIMGAAASRLTDWGGFPLLIKYLDARENLSVQVHPDDEYARRHPGAYRKSEAWVVIDAEPGAVIYKGLRAGVTRTIFEQHIRDGSVVNDLLSIPVKPGDCHYLPGGTCHALGAGLLVAEIQTPSDTTFRVYDWGRSSRPLHIEQAMECMFTEDRVGDPVEADSDHARTAPLAFTVDGVTTTALAVTGHFEIEGIDALAGATFPIVTQDQPAVLMMIAGHAQIEGPFDRITLTRGATTLIPASLEGAKAVFADDSRLLHVMLPSPLRNMLARFR